MSPSCPGSRSIIAENDTGDKDDEPQASAEEGTLIVEESEWEECYEEEQMIEDA